MGEEGRMKRLGWTHSHLFPFMMLGSGVFVAFNFMLQPEVYIPLILVWSLTLFSFAHFNSLLNDEGWVV